MANASTFVTFLLATGIICAGLIQAVYPYHLLNYIAQMSSQSQLHLLATVVITSLPHWYYAWIWTNPKAWIGVSKKLSSDHPSDVMSHVAHVIKIVQFATLTMFYISLGIPTIDELINNGLVWRVLGVLFFIAGQVLNVGVYNAIGSYGVYYGCRLGKTIPWCDGFPYSHVPHPQYVGAVLSFWGMGLVAHTPLHNAFLVVLGIEVGVCYAISSYIEQEM